MPRWDRAISVDRRKIAVAECSSTTGGPTTALWDCVYVRLRAENYLILFFQFDFNEIHTTSSTFITCVNALAAFLSVTTFGPHHLWTEWGPERALAQISRTRTGERCYMNKNKKGWPLHCIVRGLFLLLPPPFRGGYLYKNLKYINRCLYKSWRIFSYVLFSVVEVIAKLAARHNLAKTKWN